MAGAAVVRLDGDLGWEAFEIPGGSVPVSLTRLRVDPASRASTLLVRFPDGFEREDTGYYEAPEEMVILEGVLRMSGVTLAAGDWAYVPARYLRRQTSTDPSVLALTRFSGPARWVKSTRGRATPIVPRRLEVGLAADSIGSPIGTGRAWLLQREDRHSSWLLQGVTPGQTSLIDTELLSLSERTWAWVPAGASFPELEGACFCRTFHQQG